MISLQQHLAPGSPKRILSLDGGGIRGALTLGFLEKMEDVLRKQNGNDPNFRLCDYFDLIGGTSTGSIIAACLAIGKSAKEIREMYFELGGKIFAKKYKWWNIFQTGKFLHAGYDHVPLEDQLKAVFGNMTLGDERLRTGLCVVAKRADTNSVWPLINHPDGKYYSSVHGNNSKIELWKAVRASAAAPTYFLPQSIEVGGGLSRAAFVDGGVSMANNPSLQLLMVATLKGFPFRWKTGVNNILLISVGTGMSKWSRLPEKMEENNLLHWASQIPDMLMQDASWQNQAILQWMSHSNTCWSIDGETGDLNDDCLTGEDKTKALLTYQRYNLWLDKPTLDQLMNKTYTQDRVDSLVEMSNADNRYELYDIGKAAAEKGAKVGDLVHATPVLEDHFPASFKI